MADPGGGGGGVGGERRVSSRSILSSHLARNLKKLSALIRFVTSLVTVCRPMSMLFSLQCDGTWCH